MGDIVTSCSVRIAGDKFDEAIINYVKRKYNLLIGERTAEAIKMTLGSAYPNEEIESSALDIKGRNMADGLPKNVTITGPEVREALEEPLGYIVDAIKNTLEKTPPELAADIIDNGIMLTGGGALIRGLDRLITQETGMPVHVAENAIDCVAEGTGKRSGYLTGFLLNTTNLAVNKLRFKTKMEAEGLCPLLIFTLIILLAYRKRRTACEGFFSQ